MEVYPVSMASLRGLWPVPALLCLILVAAACGGADPTATPVPPTPTPVPVATSTPTPVPPTPPPVPTATPAVVAPKTGGTLRMRFLFDIRQGDPYDVRGQADAAVLAPIFNHLVMVDPQDLSRIVGDLAREFEISDDGTVFTFALRQGVSWHDGTPFTSKDIVFNVERGKSREDPRKTTMASRYALLESVEALDDHAVRLTLERPSASFLSNLAVVVNLMFPAHIDPSLHKDHPVGTGPFRFNSIRLGSDFTWERNPSYWKKDGAGRSLPYVDAVQYFIIGDSVAGAAAFRTGRTDLTMSNFDSDWTNAQNEKIAQEFPQAERLLSPTNGFDLKVPQKAPWTDPKVRRALHLGFDRQTWNELALEGLAEPLGGLMLPVSLGGVWSLPPAELATLPGFRADQKADDIAAAKDLLREAGVDPASVTLKVVGGRFFTKPVEGMASLIHDTLGFNVTVDIVPSGGDQTAREIAGDFDIALNSRSFYQDDPFNLVEPYVASSGGRNYQKWVNPRIDALLDEQDRALDPARRRQLIQDLEREVFDWAVIIPAAMNQGVAVTREYVKNVTPRAATWIPAFYFRMEAVWLDK